MAQSLVIEWLNENAFRAYPIRFDRDREVVLTGFGVASPGAYDAAAGGWLLNGGMSTQGVRAQFLKQVLPGDFIQLAGVRAEVLRPNRSGDLTDTTLYLRDTLNVVSSSYSYFVVKKNFSPDKTLQAQPNFEALILDANIVYSTIPQDVSLLGKLVSMYPSGVDLQIEVGGQSIFTVLDYKNAVYPYYTRNVDGSLLVLGDTAKWVETVWFFNNYYFEHSVVNQLDGDWRGVSSLQFNDGPVLTGVIDFVEGYQLELTVDRVANTLKLAAGAAYGKPIGCDSLFEETVPHDCNELISFINGVFARTGFAAVDLQAGKHIVLYPDPDRHRIYVGLTFGEDDICTELPERPVTQI